MPRSRRVAHEFVIAARLAGRSLRRRLAQGAPAVTTDAGFRAELEPWLAALAGGTRVRPLVRQAAPGQPAVARQRLELAPGDQATVLAAGRVYLSRALDVWVSPALRLWCRLGDGPVFRGTRPTNTLTADRGGRLMLGSRFPGEWLDPVGSRCAEGREFAGPPASCRYWSCGGLVAWTSTRCSADSTRSGARPNWSGPSAAPGAGVPAPERWSHDWRIGPSEIFQTASAADGRSVLHCRTHADVGILQRDARWPLAPGTRLKWSWCVHALPSDLAEDTVPSHDYLSIAVEFDDGQNITYFWSAALPPETVFRCPLRCGGTSRPTSWSAADPPDSGAGSTRSATCTPTTGASSAAGPGSPAHLADRRERDAAWPRPLRYANIRLTNNERTLQVL